MFFCKKHIAHKARHGSHWHPTYKAAELKPYTDAALSFIDASRADFYVAAALMALEALLGASGAVTPASSLRGMTPNERARVAMARLREAQVSPATLLAIHLGMAALIEEDPGSHRVTEFRLVQTAKAAHRLASGYHRKWDFPLNSGGTAPLELHAYPRSSGRVLRHMGEMIERCCELAAQYHLTDVLALKVERFGKHPAILNPTHQAAVF